MSMPLPVRFENDDARVSVEADPDHAPLRDFLVDDLGENIVAIVRAKARLAGDPYEPWQALYRHRRLDYDGSVVRIRDVDGGASCELHPAMLKACLQEYLQQVGAVQHRRAMERVVREGADAARFVPDLEIPVSFHVTGPGGVACLPKPGNEHLAGLIGTDLHLLPGLEWLIAELDGPEPRVTWPGRVYEAHVADGVTTIASLDGTHQRLDAETFRQSLAAYRQALIDSYRADEPSPEPLEAEFPPPPSEEPPADEPPASAPADEPPVSVPADEASVPESPPADEVIEEPSRDASEVMASLGVHAHRSFVRPPAPAEASFPDEPRPVPVLRGEYMLAAPVPTPAPLPPTPQEVPPGDAVATSLALGSASPNTGGWELIQTSRATLEDMAGLTAHPDTCLPRGTAGTGSGAYWADLAVLDGTTRRLRSGTKTFLPPEADGVQVMTELAVTLTSDAALLPGIPGAWAGLIAGVPVHGYFDPDGVGSLPLGSLGVSGALTHFRVLFPVLLDAGIEPEAVVSFVGGFAVTGQAHVLAAFLLHDVQSHRHHLDVVRDAPPEWEHSGNACHLVLGAETVRLEHLWLPGHACELPAGEFARVLQEYERLLGG